MGCAEEWLYGVYPPPAVRGNLGHLLRYFAVDGSIRRDDAGEPERRTGRYRLSVVYPRVCGGTFLHSVDQWLQGGLSPRVRGNHWGLMRDERMMNGSIPACAGNLLRQNDPCGKHDHASGS